MMRGFVFPCTLAVLITLVFAGCGKTGEGRVESGHEAQQGDAGYHPEGFAADVTAFDVKGVVREVRADGWKALIAHEEIPGYMGAMSMQFDVKDTNELAGLKPGDAISFRMLVTEDDGWIDSVRKTGSIEVPASAAPVSAPAFVELEPGDEMPDCLLTNQFGAEFRLSELEGNVVALTFIFTRCPFPVYCPRMNNNLAEAQEALSSAPMSTVSTNWQLLSISFDPEYDTPERLRAYAESYKYDPKHWIFATGSVEDIRRLGTGVGLAFNPQGGTIDHNVRTVVVNAEGKIQRIFAGNEWKAEELVAEMKALLQPRN